MKSLMRQGERLWARSVVHNYLIGGRSKRKIADDRMALPAVNSVEGGNFRSAQIADVAAWRRYTSGSSSRRRRTVIRISRFHHENGQCGGFEA
jgi:hypothetical protein